MFTQIIFFILALLVYHTRSLGPPPPVSDLWTNALSILFLLILFGLESWRRFHRLRLSALDHRGGLSAFQRGFQQTEQVLMILSLVFFAFEVYLLDFKSLVSLIPGTERFSAWEGAWGMSLYLTHLVILWGASQPAREVLFPTSQRRWPYIRSQLRFNLPILFPWFFISFLSDLIALVSAPRLRAFLDQPLGELAFLLAFLVLLSVFFPFLIKTWWRCRPLPDGEKKEAVLAFCREMGSPFQGIFLWPALGGQALTAGVMGLVRPFRYLLITPALLDLLDPEELKGVVAHEVGHIRKRHLLFYLIFFGGYILLAVFFSRWLLGFLFRFPFFADLFVSLQQYSEDLSSLVMTLPLALGLILYFRYLFGFFMRNFERQADLYALRALGSPAPLIRSLEKIAYASGQSRDLPSWHHFSIAERVHFLSLAARFPRWIAAHDRKVYATVTLFFSLLLGLGLYGVRERIWLYSGPADDPRALETLLRRELRAKPGETQTLLALAILYHEGKRLTQAKEAYEKVLAQDPENPLALNNLAWLLATAKEPDLFQPQKALELAQKAAALKPEPMILDTLAEAYLANGRPDKALEVIRRALAQHPSNRGYYLSQEERFQKALKEKP